mmetsp:Transcript_45671/g.121129  ORF Transcript_45671/g.121129 Transcript_45671/m.121129 type:complete len:207 (+) Transcript_45671:891-1511(+)
MTMTTTMTTTIVASSTAGGISTTIQDEGKTNTTGATSTTMTTTTTTTTVAAATVSGSFSLTTTAEGKSFMCVVAKLDVNGDTWSVLVTALLSSGVSMEGAAVGPLTCSDTTSLRGRRLQDVTFGLLFNVAFAATSTAVDFANSVANASSMLVDKLQSVALSDLNVTVSATLGDLAVAITDDSASGTRGRYIHLGVIATLAAIGALQ